ncbi:MAG: OB-fold nucleic acid binding domain-containing protein [Acidimicrobiales bacterium]|nr:OB-fold nucleic acid binding domain-containing protein [Acidimicrobiales bacterium]
MALKGFMKRLTASVQELDAARLSDRYCGLGLTPIAEVPLRRPVRVAGELQRSRVVPRAGSPSLQILIKDGTGEIYAVFTGRRRIGGLDAGRGVVLEGVAREEGSRRVILNPAYTLLGRG